MPNYEIPPYPVKRLRYFNNQFLIEQDFIDEQATHLAHERAHLRALCAPGVLEGLDTTSPGPTAALSVGPGVAVDGAGRLIALKEPANGPEPSALASGDYLLHIRYAEVASDMATNTGGPGGGQADFTRWLAKPIIDASLKTAAVPDGAIVLASFTVASGAISAGTLSLTVRQYSGLRLPGPGVAQTLGFVNGGQGNDTAQLGGALTIRRDRGDGGVVQTPSLTLTNAGNAAPGAATGEAAIYLNPYDPGTAPPSLQIKARADGTGSGDLVVLSKPPGDATAQPVERLRIKSTGETVVAGAATLSSTLNVTGAAALQSTLAVTGNVTSDLVLAADKHVIISGNGRFKHGIKTINVPLALLGSTLISGTQVSATIGGSGLFLPVVGVPVRVRIRAIRATVEIVASATVTVDFNVKTMTGTPASWNSVVTPGTKNIVGVQLISVDASYEVPQSAEMQIKVTGTGSGNKLYLVELDYDQP